MIEKPYADQLVSKTTLVTEVMRLGTRCKVQATVASPLQWAYRERGSFLNEGRSVGLLGAGGKVVDTPECLVVSEAIVKRMNALRRAGESIVRRTVLVTAVGEKASTSLDAPVPAPLRVPLLGGKAFMLTSPLVFGQANRAVMELIAARILRLLGGRPRDHLLELYSGSGALTIPMAMSGLFGRITAVEVNPEACEMARTAVLEQNLEGVTVLCGDVAQLVSQLRSGLERIRAAVVNPPASGMSKDVRQLLSCPQLRELQDIVYVSCNPLTLARDVRHLEMMGWRTVEVAPYDMMPQTGHVEVVVHLTRVWRGPMRRPQVVWRSHDMQVEDVRVHENCDGFTGLQRTAGSKDGPAKSTWSVLVRGRLAKSGMLKAYGETVTFETLKQYQRSTLARMSSLLDSASLMRGLTFCHHPVVGGAVDRDTRVHYRLQHGLERPFLHCHSLSIADKTFHSAQGDVSPDLQLVLKSMDLASE